MGIVQNLAAKMITAVIVSAGVSAGVLSVVGVGYLIAEAKFKAVKWLKKRDPDAWKRMLREAELRAEQWDAEKREEKNRAEREEKNRAERESQPV